MESVDFERPVRERGQLEFPARRKKLATHAHSRFLRVKGVVSDLLHQIVQVNGVSRLELHDSPALLEGDFDFLHVGNFLHGHAHGVGANPSIHPEDGQVDSAKLRVHGRSDK